ncbi:amidohydrolase family protein [Streptomyces sp. NPDC056296]|uniref:amidohydrolase family protein n=1 Tax=Streptomyces sp. NPDC056296 TaxID=3345775 RepID=UPI0035DC314E
MTPMTEAATGNVSPPRIVAVEEHFRTPELEAVLAGPERLFSRHLADKLAELGERRIETMDLAGIDVTVLSSSAPAIQSAEPRQATKIAQQVNDALADAVARYPARLAGFATLATPDPRAAAGELERGVRELGFKGAMIHGHTDGRFLDDPFFWPMLEAAEALDVPVYLHPTVAPQPVMDAYYSGLPEPLGMILGTGAWGWHVETGMHAMRMILGGVFRRFPRLQLIIGHLGEGLPFFLDRATKVLRRPSPDLAEHFEHSYRNNLYLTTSAFFTDAPLQCALAVTPPERILFATDYPYSDAKEGCDWIRTTSVVDEPTRAAIMHRNSERLLGLPTA